MKTIKINEVMVQVVSDIDGIIIIKVNNKILNQFKQGGNCYYVYINSKKIPVHYIKALYNDELCDVVKIKGYKNYGVDPLGNIWSYNMGKRVTQQINTYGYNTVHIKINGKYKTLRVHRIVALMFLPNPNNYGYINHIDGNKMNNMVDNLEWCTRAYNSRHQAMMNYGRVGVHYRKARNNWVATITYKGNSKYIGSYTTELEAKLAYNSVAKSTLPANELLLNQV